MTTPMATPTLQEAQQAVEHCYDNLVKVFDFLTEKCVVGHPYNTYTVDDIISLAQACCKVMLDEVQARVLLFSVRAFTPCTSENERWHVRKSTLEALYGLALGTALGTAATTT